MDDVRARCKTLAGFIREAWHVLEPGRRYDHNWHIDLICAHLEAITFGKFLALGLPNRLLANVPPGAMKSLMICVLWMAWEWGPCNMPHLRYVSTSFSEGFSTRDSRKTRDLIESDWYQKYWGDTVKLERRGESDFSNTAGGWRRATPFTSLMGERGDRVLIDDPHNVKVEDEGDRNRTIRIFRESVPTRLIDPISSAIIVIMQRLHQGDVSGVIQELGLPYVHIMLPMEFEVERKCVTPFGEDPRTEDGELMFPARFPREVVESDKVPLSSYGVAGQFQQRPVPRGGIMFKRTWFNLVPSIPTGYVWVRGWDLAASTDMNAARTAGVLVGRSPSTLRFCIAHVVRVLETGAQVRRTIKATAEQDVQRVGPDVVQDMPQDPGQAGKVQAADMVAMLAGFRAYATTETGDKFTRAQPVAAQAEGGNFDYVAGPWNEEFFSEMEVFSPAAKFKDQGDALSRAFARLISAPRVPMTGVMVVTAVRTHYADNQGV